jgi:restriction endonuclease Mrr
LALPAPPDFEHKHGKPTKRMTKEEIAKQAREQEQDATRRLKKSLIIQILLKLQNLKNEELNEQLKELLLSSNRRFNKNLYGYYNKGIMTLLRYWGDSDTIMNEYRKEQDRIEELDRKA